MKRILVILIASALAALFTSNQANAHMKVAEFMERCEVYSKHIDRVEDASPKQLMNAAYCLGLMEGVGHTVYWTLNINDLKFKEWRLCFPINFNNKIAIRLLVEYLTINETAPDEYVIPWFISMLKNNFECKFEGEKHVVF